MKTRLVLLISTIVFCTYDKVVGNYQTHGSTIKLKADFTYEYKWYGHMISGWSKGNWRINNDTIHFEPVLVYDTLRRVGQQDSLLLSGSNGPTLIVADSADEWYYPKRVGEQTTNIPKKYFYKSDRLYIVQKDGKLNLKKQQDSLYMNSPFYDPWYQKVEK